MLNSTGHSFKSLLLKSVHKLSENFIMVDAARQMLDELMGRNRNLHPSEAVRKVNWDDPDVSAI